MEVKKKKVGFLYSFSWAGFSFGLFLSINLVLFFYNSIRALPERSEKLRLRSTRNIVFIPFIHSTAKHQLPKENPQGFSRGQHHGRWGGRSSVTRGRLHAAKGAPGLAERPQWSQHPDSLRLLLSWQTRRRGGVDRVWTMHGNHDGGWCKIQISWTLVLNFFLIKMHSLMLK